MRFHYGHVLSKFEGTPAEEGALCQALIPPDWEEDQTTLYRLESHEVYTGLLPYIRSKVGEVEVLDPAESPYYHQVPDIPDDLCSSEQDPSFRLRDYQQGAIQKALRAGRGVIEVAAGGGKTEIAAGLIIVLLAQKQVDQVLYIVGTKHLLDQTVLRLQKRGVPHVGILGGGKRRITGQQVVVATPQTINKKLQAGDEQVYQLIGHTKAIVGDEIHHGPAPTWAAPIEAALAFWRFGLTATMWDDPRGYSSSDLILMGLIGPPCVRVSMGYLIARGFLATPRVLMPPIDRGQVNVHPRSFKAWDRVYGSGIERHTYRNAVVLSYARWLYEHGHKVLTFCQHVDHGLFLCFCLAKAGYEPIMMKGSSQVAQFTPDGQPHWETWDIKQIADYIDGMDRCLVVGSPVADEGLDFPSVSALIMAGAMQKYRRTVQRCGRGMRPKPGDNTVVIIDPYDLHHEFLAKHSEYRRWTYTTENIVVSHDPAAILGEAVPYDLGLVRPR